MKVIWIIGALLLFGICAACYWFDDIYHVCFESYRTGNHGEFGDKYGALNTLFTGWAFVAAGSAYWVQYNALQEAKRQTAIVREQNMDAACFELLNYLETRKKAIGDQQPFDWIKRVYELQHFPEKHVTDLQESGTWYRSIILWLDRVINMFPDDPQLQKQYIDSVLLSLSINEQRCLKCYSCCADGITFQKDENIQQTVQKYKDYLRSFIKTRQNKDKIEQNLQSFFDDESLDLQYIPCNSEDHSNVYYLRVQVKKINHYTP